MFPSLNHIFIDGKQKTLKQHLLSDRSEARLFLADNCKPVNLPNLKKSLLKDYHISDLSAFLGNNTKSVNPAPKKDTSLYDNRFKLQSKSRDINHDKRVKKCCRAMISGSNKVSIKKSATGYSYSDLHRCGSVWICPVCSAHVSQKRRRDLGFFIDQVYKQDHHVSMLTLTVPHYSADDIKFILDGICKAWKTMQNRKTWKGFKNVIDLVGTVRTLEVTHGENGFHPHFHILLISKKQIDDSCLFDFLKWWQSACLAAGLRCPNEKGVSFVRCTKSIKDYIQKWGIDYEMTAGNQSKKSDWKGLHPFQMLAAACGTDQEAKKYSALFRLYSLAFHGKRQLVYSEGLKALYGCSEEKTDEELLKDEEQKADTICFINKLGWKQILQFNNRGDILDHLSEFHNLELTIDYFCLREFVTYPDLTLDIVPDCNFHKNAITRCHR